MISGCQFLTQEKVTAQVGLDDEIEKYWRCELYMYLFGPVRNFLRLEPHVHRHYGVLLSTIIGYRMQ